MSATCKNSNIGKGPKRIVLLGDRAKPESAEHVIEFPGGAIEVARTSDGDYWAHIIIHRDQPIEDTDGRVSAQSEVVASRIGRAHPHGADGPEAIADHGQVDQIAVLIRRVKP